MKDRNLLFSSPMIEALSAMRKRQTRRLDVIRWINAPIGTRIWVRETLRYDWVEKTWRYSADGKRCLEVVGATLETPTPDRWPLGVCVSIHMPRRLSRLTLITTAPVRSEALQAITEADAIAEGAYVGKASGRIADNYLAMAVAGVWFATARTWYADLWNRLHATQSWAENPPVAVIAFNTLRLNIDAAP